VAQLADLRQQQVHCEPHRHQRQQRAGWHAGQRLQLGRLGPGGRRRPLAQLVEQAWPAPRAGAGGGGQGGRLQQRQRLGDRLDADGLGGAVDGPVGADQAGQRGEQLGDVAGQPAWAGGGLGKAEVQQPGSPVGVDQQVGQAQVAVGDAGGA